MMYKLLRTIISGLKSHKALALENLALRQQLDILRRTMKRPRLTKPIVFLDLPFGAALLHIPQAAELVLQFVRQLHFFAVLDGRALGQEGGQLLFQIGDDLRVVF